jgi:hypothetical protein
MGDGGSGALDVARASPYAVKVEARVGRPLE